MIRKTLGGDRLGSGKKQKLELHGYERSTHDLSYLFKTTQAPGTLIPFMKLVVLPGDTIDIDLETQILTLPTIGPLFGSFKVQLDVFQTFVRHYQGQLHNNKLKIGMDMSQIKLPIFKLKANTTPTGDYDPDNWQVNPSSILAYLGIRGIGQTGTDLHERAFNAIPLLAYWEIYKNYYANKQEEIGAVLHTPSVLTNETIGLIEIQGQAIPQSPAGGAIVIMAGNEVDTHYTGAVPDLQYVYINGYTPDGSPFQYDLKSMLTPTTDSGTVIKGFMLPEMDGLQILNWTYAPGPVPGQGKPKVQTFNLSNIDDMRETILSAALSSAQQDIGSYNITPYNWLTQQPNGIPNIRSSQEGLALKTYQSDLFNNWLQTEWIDGTGGINDISKVDTSAGFFKIDQLNLAKKVYDILNRIAVSGGSYKDWLDVTYDHIVPWIPESPIYIGGLSKELVFQAVVSNAQAGGASGQPLGTLAGRGVLSQKHKGGHVTAKIDEPGYLIGLVSLTPRLDYSQGNDWDVYSLMTMDDFHKPGLDEIGFQELITEQMHWATTNYNGTTWVQRSAGKQPAWINYMTMVNKSLGNFAIKNNSMFMTLNRDYHVDYTTHEITDLTTYIDPSKYNNIFAQTSLDAQNFWTQIAVNITARRKMSAKLMPNL